MSSGRLVDRVPSAEHVGVARLESHRLVFHKKGKDGSAKCDAQHTGNPEDFIFGVVYSLPETEKVLLDQKEGLGHGYDEKQVLVQATQGEWLEAVTYFALKVDPDLKPFHWYKQHVLIGARENGLPADYIQWIDSVSSIEDNHPDRYDSEMAIYR